MTSETRFVHATNLALTDQKVWQRVGDAGRRLNRAFPASTPPDHANAILLDEAGCSSAIEGVLDPKMVSAHHQALLAFIQRDLTPDSLLQLHHDIMGTQPHAQPGQYRTVQVIVGSYRPPPPEQVPDLMTEFFEYTSRPRLDRIVKATWAHFCFEHIHPFADGNGRTGRAISTHLLRSPIPLSRYILANRYEYYRLLAAGTWSDFLHWTLTGILHLSKHYESPPPTPPSQPVPPHA